MTLEQVKEHFKNAEEVIDYDGYVLKISDIYNLDIYNHFENWFTNISDDNCVCLYSTHSGFAQITKYKKMKKKTKVSNELIKSYHKDACSEWKTRIENDFPELFPKLELEVGKWYKGEDHFLFQFNGRYGNFTHSGFSMKGYWTDSNLGVHKCDNYQPATDEEVEKALIDEAKKRGFKVGVKFKGVQGIQKDELIEIGKNYSIKCNSKGLYCENSYIFHGGKWATIIQPEKEIEHNGHTYVLKD